MQISLPMISKGFRLRNPNLAELVEEYMALTGQEDFFTVIYDISEYYTGNRTISGVNLENCVYSSRNKKDLARLIYHTLTDKRFKG